MEATAAVLVTILADDLLKLLGKYLLEQEKREAQKKEQAETCSLAT